MMMRKKYIFVALAFILFLPSFLSYAEPTERVEAEKLEGRLTSKDEVVYATLKADGDLDEIYVVNTLDVAKAGEVLDYGEYSSVKNLTDLSKLVQDGQSVQINAPEGKFYYQGNMSKDTELPWNIKVSYLLDGQIIDPSDLAGKTGHFEIKIDTTANENVDLVFYENYLLQVSLMLSNTYGNIEAVDGMLANAGKNKQITFTVMPGQEENLMVEADVEDFEFQGIEIAAIPSTLPIDTSEMDNMTDDMATLSDAIGDLKDGVADLKNGVSQLNSGAAELRNGSSQYKSGINEIGGGSPEINAASQSINDALMKISNSLAENSGEMDLTSLSELPAGLTELADGLAETAKVLSGLKETYLKGYRELDTAIKGIPDYQLQQNEIDALKASDIDSNVVNNLLASYEAAQNVKVTYFREIESFLAIEPTLDQVSEGVMVLSGTLRAMATEISASLEEMDMSGLAELQKGLTTLSSNYGQFHTELKKYTGGVSQLSSSYNELHSGIVALSGGTDELDEGVSELHNGVSELNEETKDLPGKMQQEINEMISEYDKSDFEPVSFVTTKNEKVYSVQFVIKTESIQKEEQKTKKKETTEEKGFWDLLLELF
jgi:putative membrane protein